MKFLPILILGGIIGAAQAVVMGGLFGPEFMAAAGWTLVIVPFGAFLGVLATGLMLRLKTQWHEDWFAFAGGWIISIGLGFAASLFAPMMLVGLGPDYQKYRFVVFFAEYSLCWFLVYGLCAIIRKGENESEV